MTVSPRIARERQERHDRRMAAAAAVVPEGHYCYRHTGRTVERQVSGAPEGTMAQVPEIEPCPYLKRLPNKPPHRNGYCRLLKAGDWMPHPHGTMFLWDAVKECDVNRGSDEDEA